jgi:enterobacterial common antigen flippase
LNLGLSVIRTKVLAILLGTVGLGILSQFYNLTGLLFTIIPIGTMGLLKYFSEYVSENKTEQINYLLRFFILLNLPIVLIISLGLIFFSDTISILLFSDSSYSKIILLYTFAIPIGLFGSLMDTYLKSLRNIKYFVLYGILNSVFGFAIFLPLLILYEYQGAIVSISFSSIIGIIIALLLSKRIGKFPRLNKVKKVDKRIIISIVKLGLVMMLLVAVQQSAFLFVRSTIAVKLGMHDVGIFQSVYGISNNYIGFFLGLLGTYSIPLISTHKTADETVIEINRTLRLLLLVYTPMIIACFVFRYLILLAFYSSAFFEAGDILFYQLMGDFTKAISWVFGLWLIPYFKIKLLLIFELINNAIFISLFYFLLVFKNYGLQSVSIAYLAAFVGHVILNLLYLKRGMGYRFAQRNLFVLIVSVFSIVIIFCTSLYDVRWGYYAVLPVVFIWGYLSVKRSDVAQLKQLLASIGKLRVNK